MDYMDVYGLHVDYIWIIMVLMMGNGLYMMINGLLVGLVMDLMKDILVAYNESWI